MKNAPEKTTEAIKNLFKATSEDFPNAERIEIVLHDGLCELQVKDRYALTRFGNEKRL